MSQSQLELVQTESLPPNHPLANGVYRPAFRPAPDGPPIDQSLLGISEGLVRLSTAVSEFPSNVVRETRAVEFAAGGGALLGFIVALLLAIVFMGGKRTN